MSVTDTREVASDVVSTDPGVEKLVPLRGDVEGDAVAVAREGDGQTEQDGEQRVGEDSREVHSLQEGNLVITFSTNHFSVPDHAVTNKDQ